MKEPQDLSEEEKNKQEETKAENADTLNIGYLVELQNQNNELKEQIEKLQDEILRAKAESENLRKRYEKQISDTRDYSISSFAKDLLGVMDNMNRALDHLPDIIEENLKNIVVGVEMTKKELETVLGKNGIIAINPQIGQIFDHNLHQVISQIESDTYNTGAIIGIPQLGYTISGRLLRPASVIVAK